MNSLPFYIISVVTKVIPHEMINPPQSTTAYHISPLTTTILPHQVLDCKDKLFFTPLFSMWILANIFYFLLCNLHIFLFFFHLFLTSFTQYLVQTSSNHHHILCFEIMYTFLSTFHIFRWKKVVVVSGGFSHLFLKFPTYPPQRKQRVPCDSFTSSQNCTTKRR